MSDNRKNFKAFIRYDGSGRTVPSSLILRKKKPRVGKWIEVPAYECCGFEPIEFDYNINTFLSRMNWCNGSVVDVIPAPNYFTDEQDGGGDEQNYISDGGCDMWDGGNAFNTNLTQPYSSAKDGGTDFGTSIPYTHTKAANSICPTPYTPTPADGVIVDGSAYFGPGSSYFTNMYPGLFILAASNISITDFSITGNLGTDGYGTDAIYISPTSYVGWTAFCKTNTDNYTYGDPSVNHIFLVRGDASGILHEFDVNSEYDDDALLSLNSTNTDIIAAVFSTQPGTPRLTRVQLRTIANQILDVASNTACVPMPSDARLKTNIVPTGGKVGQFTQYKWEWNDVAKGLKLDGYPTIGVLAQEVMASKPEAVVFDDTIGYYRVNYNALRD